MRYARNKDNMCGVASIGSYPILQSNDETTTSTTKTTSTTENSSTSTSLCKLSV